MTGRSFIGPLKLISLEQKSMDDALATLLAFVAVLIYNFALLSGATYLIVVYEWSLWTYVGAVLFMRSMSV